MFYCKNGEKHKMRRGYPKKTEDCKWERFHFDFDGANRFLVIHSEFLLGVGSTLSTGEKENKNAEEHSSVQSTFNEGRQFCHMFCLK